MASMKDDEDTSDEEEAEVADDNEGEGEEGRGDPETQVRRRLLSAQAKERLAALSDRCRLLTAQNEKLTQEVAEARSSLHDISEVLTAEVKGKTAAVSLLERQLEEAVREGERSRTTLERELAEERSQTKRELEELRTRTGEAESKLREVRDFAERKGHLDAQLAQARTELVQQQKEHEDTICSLERHTVQEKDKLRKEAAVKVKEAKAAMMALTESQLDKVTKATIVENESLSTELRYTTKRAEKLLLQTEKLAADNAALKRERDISQALAGELARKQCLSAKAVALLTARVAGQDEAHRETDGECTDLRHEVRALAAKVEMLEEQLDAARQDAAHYRALSGSQAAELAAAAAHEDEAVHFLRACLADVREQVVAVTSSPDGESGGPDPAVVQGGLDELALHQRQQALEYLFRKLTAYQAVKRGSWSQAPNLQYSFVTSRSADPISPAGALQSDPSISELLALASPLSPPANDAGRSFPTGSTSPEKMSPPVAGSLSQRGTEVAGKSRLGTKPERQGPEIGGTTTGRAVVTLGKPSGLRIASTGVH